jgi:hypothetical protein
MLGQWENVSFDWMLKWSQNCVLESWGMHTTFFIANLKGMNDLE